MFLIRRDTYPYSDSDRIAYADFYTNTDLNVYADFDAYADSYGHLRLCNNYRERDVRARLDRYRQPLR